MTSLNRHFVGVILVSVGLITFPAAVFGQPGRSGQAGAVATLGERNHETSDRDVVAQRQQIHEWLVSEMLPEGLGTPVRSGVTQREIAQVEADYSLPVKVGLTKAVNHTVSFADLKGSGVPATTLRRSLGALRKSQDGGYVFTMTVESQGAAGLRVHFSDFWLPAQAELYLFTSENQVFGPYTGGGPNGDGEFWSHTVMGERAILQLRHFGSPTKEDLEDTWFVISEIGHIGPKFLLGEGHCSYNEPCVQNVSCGADPAVNEARDAVAQMQWISGPFIYMCTGGLLADMDTSSEIPYFLSANHCISRNKDARNLECFFQLTVDCGDSCPDLFETRANHLQELRTLGATIKATNSNSDYTLFELREPAPAGSVFLGWSSEPVANTNGSNLYRISHPGGAPQAYSEHSVDTSKPTCQSWPRGPWIYSEDVYGATEGGSSGSPVVNSSGQVVGQLSGACGFNVNDPCDSVSNATVDGAFANYFDEISQFLDPVPCNPSPEVCGDGIDNDCDGGVDCADADCTGDQSCEQPPCLSSKTACNSDNECCSGNCRRGTCKGN